MKPKFRIGQRVQLKFKYMTKGKELNQIQGAVSDFETDEYYETMYTVKFDDQSEGVFNESELIKI